MKNFFTCTCLVVGLLLINHFFVNRFKTHLASRSDLAIVDQSLQNYQKLLEDLPKDVEVILASESGNGLADLQVKLSKYAGVKRLHLLTHGTDGEVILAGVHLSERNMSQYKSFWQTLRSSINNDGQLLIYSCDLASGKKGQDFVRHLSAELAISVAASKDPTGAASKGGNWNLEYVSGLVDGSSTLTPVGYDGLLIPQFTALSGDSSPLKNFVASAQTQLIYGDFDKDGDVDIHSYPGSGANNRFWQNQGNGTFTDVTDLNSNPFRNLPNKAAFSSREYTFVADFDNDGDIDVLATKRGDDKNVFF